MKESVVKKYDYDTTYVGDLIDGKRTGFALETQAFPDSINKENFPDVVYGPNRPYQTTTIYKFIW